MSTQSLAGVSSQWAVGRLIPGIALSAAIGMISVYLGGHAWVQSLGLSALTLAIVLGMLVGNTFYGRLAAQAGAGVGFSKQTLLRLGIVLYGVRLTMQDVAHVGLAGVLVSTAVVGLTFIIAIWIGQRWLGLDQKTAMLIGAGSSICGAAAVLAAEPVVKGRSDQVTVAVATVVVFGTIATFLYPVLYNLNEAWHIVPGGAKAFGIYIGSTVHEVAQVVAAGNTISAEAADAAVISKMVRVMMLAPFLIVLSAWLTRSQARNAKHAGSPDAKGPGLAVPWFAVGFVVVVVLNSLTPLPAQVNAAVTAFDTLLLATAMAALGLTTHVSAIRKAGLKPLGLALILFVWLVLGGALLNRVAQGWLG